MKKDLVVDEHIENYQTLANAVIVTACNDYMKIKCDIPLSIHDCPTSVMSLRSIITFLQECCCQKIIDKMDKLLKEYNYDYYKLMKDMHPPYMKKESKNNDDGGDLE